MQKGHLSVTLDQDLMEFARSYAGYQRITVSEIQRMQLLHGEHLYWPKLDVDLSINNLEFPEKYPLTYLKDVVNITG